jgi:hypothetical protein
MTEAEYLNQRLENQINWYSGKSGICQWRYKALRLIEIAAAALIPLLTGMGEKVPFGPWIIGSLGVLIAVAAAAGSLFKYHENWIHYRTTCEQLKHEKYLFVTRSGPYTDQDVFTLLVERVEALISKESTTWAQITKQPVKLPNGK